jgi:acetyltransferase-like isoleucine patch superfamily enzyme
VPPVEIVVTREDANSDSALLVEWLVADREPVRRGQPVCVIETSKSAIEIESPADGTLVHLARAGDEVELGSALATVAGSAEEAAQVASPRRRAEPRRERGRVTRKAAQLAGESGLETEGFVTVADVEALIAARDAERGAVHDAALDGVSLAGVTLPAVYTLDDGSAGTLEPAFLDSLRSDPAAFAQLSSKEKCAAYREHGAIVGEEVRFGPGALVVAPRIVLEDGVELGESSSVECGEVFAVGALTAFGPRLEVRCRRAYVGCGGYVARDVRIGGGGSGDPQALLALGDLVYLGDQAFLNPGRPIVAGAEVFVTMRSVLVTHNIGHSLLEGFENRFAPIVLEDRAQVGIGAVVYAGCRIGAEAIVASNSYVVSDIPARKLAIGVPARVAGSARRELGAARVLELAETIVEDLHELLSLRGHRVARVTGATEPGFTVGHEAGSGRVLLLERVDAAFRPPEPDGETVVLTLGLDGPPPVGVAVVDLLGRRVEGPGGIVLESVREFCRKRGIRLEPGPWRYRGGLI